MSKTTTAIAAALIAALAMPTAAWANELMPYEEPSGEWTAGGDELAPDYEPTYAPQAQQTQTINAYDGVYEYGGRVETYYSSNVLYHWRTPEWWADENGFWRTPEGYYVVAASDYAQGSVIETSMGLAQVLDTGCAWGVTDFYVNWL